MITNVPHVNRTHVSGRMDWDPPTPSEGWMKRCRMKQELIIWAEARTRITSPLDMTLNEAVLGPAGTIVEKT
jgi:hypothetical protein